MSHLQTLLDDGVRRPRTTADPPAQRFLFHSGEVVWSRLDWAEPVGAFLQCSWTPRDSRVRDQIVQWTSLEIGELRLSRKAALLLLQGMQLTTLLIPNHQLRHEQFPDGLHAGHLVLRVDPWEYWRPVPALTNLVVAALNEVPAGLAPSEVLGALAFDSI